MTTRTTTLVSLLTLGLWIGACSSGLGNDPRRRDQDATADSATGNLPVGLDLGFTPTQPIDETALAATVVPAIGSGAARDVVLLAFTTAADAADGDGAGTRLSRDAVTDGNAVTDVFVAALSAQAVERRAFSQALAGKFRHPRCTTCHSMQAPDTQAFTTSSLAHAGPAPGAGFPSNDAASCRPCHVDSSTFPVVGWQAPAASFDIRPKSVAQLAVMAQNAPTGDLEHFVNDSRVLWALDSAVTPRVGGRNGAGGSQRFLEQILGWEASGHVVGTAAAVHDVTLASRTSGDAAGNGASGQPAVRFVPNADFDPTSSATAFATNPVGTLHVVFTSAATNLIGADGNGASDVFRVRVELRAEEDTDGNLTAGSVNLRVVPGSMLLASSRDGAVAAANGASSRPAIGGDDGELVVFESLATDLVTGFVDGNGGGADVFVRDVDATTTRLVSQSLAGSPNSGNGASARPAIDATGSAIGFESDAFDLVAGDTNAVRDVFYATVLGGAPTATTRASVDGDGTAGSGGACGAASVFADGSRVLVAFESAKADLAAGLVAATNVFLFDSDAGGSTLLNQLRTSEGTTIGGGSAVAPVIAEDGRVVAFTSAADDIDVLRRDGNRGSDLFLVETAPLQSGLVLPYRASVTGSEGADADGASANARIAPLTGSGEFPVGVVVYTTTATNLGTSDGTDLMVTFVAETSGVVADFEALPVVGAPPLVVQFTDRSSGSPTAWAWDFGDGTTSTAQNPSHTYTTVGTFTVTLTATSDLATDTRVAANHVRVLGPVVADFTSAPGSVAQSIDFTDTSTELPDSWAWDFGDGGTSTDQNPTHVFAAAGTFTVTLQASGPGGPSAAPKVAQVTVQAVIPPPAVTIVADVVSGTVPLTVNFSFTNGGGPVTSVAWDFGNPGSGGANSSTANAPSHTFASAATFTVQLTATGPGGGGGDTQQIVVAAPTWTQVYATIRPGAVGTNCTACHQTPLVGGAPFSLESKAVAFTNLVNAASTTGTCGTARVIPFDPGQSTLVLRLEGTSCGQQMFGLTADEITALRAWIAAGALNN
jgi:PKD repeat protein